MGKLAHVFGCIPCTYLTDPSMTNQTRHSIVQQLDHFKRQLEGRVSDKGIYLTEDLQFVSLFLMSGQGSKLLQQYRTWWGGDVQEVLEGLEDGAWRDTSLIGPVTDYTCRKEEDKCSVE